MKLNWIEIENFKAIENTRVPLSDFTVLVGTNGSGKSSVLQALHWMLQSARNSNVSPEQANKGSTLSEIEATYMPSPDYKNASHSSEYGNFAAAPKMDIRVEAEIEGADPLIVPMWIKSARNEGISVHVPSNNPLTAQIRSPREVSAYIPGLAGIPLSEEKRSKLIVYRQAAAGDANTVLRNILDLARASKTAKGVTALEEVERLVSTVLGKIKLKVEFNQDKHYKIFAQFQTEAMRVADPKRFKPLELAGIGFLQVIQIFSYLVYFKPRILLVDEPDSHLHPDIQEKLVSTLISSAREYECQVILTTHSPSVVRSLTADTSVVWMKSGKVQEAESKEIRRSMGWGLLDKSILLVTEDTKVGMLNSIIAQWPDLSRKVAVWAARGNSKLPPADVLAGLTELFGAKMKIVLHRDCDFMLEQDRLLQARPYADRGLDVWFTDGSDIESLWCLAPIVAAHFSISEADAENLINAASQICEEGDSRTRFNTKRNEITNIIEEYKNGVAYPAGNQEAFESWRAQGPQLVHLGKDLAAKIRTVAKDRNLANVSSFGKAVPEGVEVGGSLREKLEQLA